MKKVMYLMVGMLYSILSIAGVGLPTQISSSATGGQLNISTNGQCQYIDTFFIRVSNLDVLNNVSCDDVSITELKIPESHEKMIIRFIVNGVTEIVVDPVFSKEWCGDGSSPMNSLWVYKHVMPVDMTGACYNNPSGGQYVSSSSELLMEELPNSLVPYPICSYSAPADLFSCLYFDETAGLCTPNDPACSNHTLGLSSTWYWVNCAPNCLVGVPLGYGVNSEFNKFDREKASNNDTESPYSFKISPNPFDSRLYISWLEESEGVSIKMYNAGGGVVKVYEKKSNVKGERIELDVSDLPSGIYYISIQSEQFSKYAKVIKS